MTDAVDNEPKFLGPSAPNVRRNIALFALKGRLGFSVRAHRTDAFALSSVRGWAAKEGVHIATTKQGLKWVEDEIAKIKAERAANGEQPGSEESA